MEDESLDERKEGRKELVIMWTEGRETNKKDGRKEGRKDVWMK